MATEKATPEKTVAVSEAASVDMAAVLGVLPSTQLNPVVTDWARYILMLLGLVGGVLFINKAEENSFIFYCPYYSNNYLQHILCLSHLTSRANHVPLR